MREGRPESHSTDSRIVRWRMRFRPLAEAIEVGGIDL
jgi:hypothetical protein